MYSIFDNNNSYFHHPYGHRSPYYHSRYEDPNDIAMMMRVRQERQREAEERELYNRRQRELFRLHQQQQQQRREAEERELYNRRQRELFRLQQQQQRREAEERELYSRRQRELFRLQQLQRQREEEEREMTNRRQREIFKLQQQQHDDPEPYYGTLGWDDSSDVVDSNCCENKENKSMENAVPSTDIDERLVDDDDIIMRTALTNLSNDKKTNKIKKKIKKLLKKKKSKSSLQENAGQETEKVDHKVSSNEHLMEENNHSVDISKQQMTQKKRKANDNAVIVEDASDSESEDEPIRSPWRNRRPSPGQWMEPIEFETRPQ